MAKKWEIRLDDPTFIKTDKPEVVVITGLGYILIDDSRCEGMIILEKEAQN